MPLAIEIRLIIYGLMVLSSFSLPWILIKKERRITEASGIIFAQWLLLIIIGIILIPH